MKKGWYGDTSPKDLTIKHSQGNVTLECTSFIAISDGGITENKNLLFFLEYVKYELNKRMTMVTSIQIWRLNIKIANEANSTEHWAVKAKRHKKQKMAIKRAFLTERPSIQLPLRVVMTRIASRELDVHDNLKMSMKWAIDSICEWFYPGLAPGRADGMGGIRFEFKQEKGSKPKEYGLRIEMISDEIST
jgi:hypothetical protein